MEIPHQPLTNASLLCCKLNATCFKSSTSSSCPSFILDNTISLLIKSIPGIFNSLTYNIYCSHSSGFIKNILILSIYGISQFPFISSNLFSDSLVEVPQIGECSSGHGDSEFDFLHCCLSELLNTRTVFCFLMIYLLPLHPSRLFLKIPWALCLRCQFLFHTLLCILYIIDHPLHLHFIIYAYSFIQVICIADFIDSLAIILKLHFFILASFITGSTCYILNNLGESGQPYLASLFITHFFFGYAPILVCIYSLILQYKSFINYRSF